MSWHPVALSAFLPAGRVTGARVQGAPVAVWRDGAGRAHVWEDRCPHRGMRLALGFVRDGLLTCLYHGWRFGPEGGCRHIPAHPEITPPATIQTTRHAAAEAGGLIWASLDGDGAPAWAGAWEGLTSVAVAAPAAAAREALDTETDPLAPDGRGPQRPRTAEGGVWRLGALAVALLDEGNGQCVLHALAAPAATRADRRALVAGLWALVRRLEGRA